MPLNLSNFEFALELEFFKPVELEKDKRKGPIDGRSVIELLQ